MREEGRGDEGLPSRRTLQVLMLLSKSKVGRPAGRRRSQAHPPGRGFSVDLPVYSPHERSPAPVRPSPPPLWTAVGAEGRLRYGGPGRDDAGDRAERLGEEHSAALPGGFAGGGRRDDRIPGERHGARCRGTAAAGGGRGSGPRLLRRAHGGGEPGVLRQTSAGARPAPPPRPPPPCP